MSSAKSPEKCVLKEYCPNLFKACLLQDKKQLKSRANKSMTPPTTPEYSELEQLTEALLLTAAHRSSDLKAGGVYEKLMSMVIKSSQEALAAKEKQARAELRYVNARYNQVQGLTEQSWSLKELCPTIWGAAATMTTKQMKGNKEFTPQKSARSTDKECQIEALLRTSVHRAPKFEIDAWLGHADKTGLFKVGTTDSVIGSDVAGTTIQAEFPKLVAYHVVMCAKEGKPEHLKIYENFGVKVAKKDRGDKVRVRLEDRFGSPEKVESTGGAASDGDKEGSVLNSRPGSIQEDKKELKVVPDSPSKMWTYLVVVGLLVFTVAAGSIHFRGGDGDGYVAEL
eukprot:gene13640-28366_t